MIRNFANRGQIYKSMNHCKSSHKQDFHVLTKRILFELLRTKGEAQTVPDLSARLYANSRTVDKVIQTMKGIGLITIIEESKFVYIGTNNAILKFLRYTKKRMSQFEIEFDREESLSHSSNTVKQSYNFREPKSGRKEGALQSDFVKQIVMEMLFDTSKINR